MSELAPATLVENAIHLIRGQEVLLHAELAELYDAETKALVNAVKRNAEPFPADFMFQLSPEEVTRLRCQTGTSKLGRRGRRYARYAFTEEDDAHPFRSMNSSGPVLDPLDLAAMISGSPSGRSPSM